MNSMTDEDEIYAVEISDCELHEDLSSIDDTDPSGPTCDSADIAYAMRYAGGKDRGRGGAHG
jgi:hypothetical protein